MRRAGLVLALVAAVLAGTGIAVASFTVSGTNHQDFTAASTLPSAQLQAQSRTNDGGAAGTQVQFGLRLLNTGDTGIGLGAVTMRYWFTADNRTGEPIAACYYATLGCSALRLSVTTLTVKREKADSYLEVGFTGSSLAPGASAQLDQLALRDPGGATFNQATDYSFLNQSSFTTNKRVTVYVDGTLVWGTEPAVEPPTTEKVDVQYANLDQDPHDNAIKLSIQAANTGTLTLDLRRLTVRYWYTKDSGAGTFLGFCDYAVLGCPTVTTRFGAVSPPRPGADSYVEAGFSSGSVAVGGNTGVIQLRVHKSDYSTFDETNDYSWGTNTSLISWTRVTAYVDGKLVWGAEP